MQLHHVVQEDIDRILKEPITYIWSAGIILL